MKRNILVLARSASPSSRWQEAFPDGVMLDPAAVLASAGTDDVVWLPVELEDWQRVLAGIAARLPGCPVVVVSNSPATQEALAALEAGARGYCHAHAVPTLLREIGQVVRMGGLWVGPELLSRFVGAVRQRLPAGPDDLEEILSTREAEVARAVAAGQSNKEVAAMLGITERTVKAHLGAAFEKLKVRDRLQLVLRLSGRVESDITE